MLRLVKGRQTVLVYKLFVLKHRPYRETPGIKTLQFNKTNTSFLHKIPVLRQSVAKKILKVSTELRAEELKLEH
jgi:hypothetical protein